MTVILNTRFFKILFPAAAILFFLSSLFFIPVHAGNMYTINDVYIPLQEDSYRERDYRGRGTCWEFTQHVYSTIWGTEFSQYGGTDDDMLREYPMGQARRITAQNAQYFVTNAENGAVFRIQEDPEAPDTMEGNRHSFILVAKNEKGCVLYHAWNSYTCISYLSWDQMEQIFRTDIDFGYFKYIKFPGAQPLHYPEINCFHR